MTQACSEAGVAVVLNSVCYLIKLRLESRVDSTKSDLGLYMRSPAEHELVLPTPGGSERGQTLRRRTAYDMAMLLLCISKVGIRPKSGVARDRKGHECRQPL